MNQLLLPSELGMGLKYSGEKGKHPLLLFFPSLALHQKDIAGQVCDVMC